MGDENQVVENSSEAVSEVVSENTEVQITESTVKIKRKKMKIEDTKNLILQNLSSDKVKSQKQLADDAGLNNRGVINALLRTLISEGKVIRERIKTDDKLNKSCSLDFILPKGSYATVLIELLANRNFG